MDNDTKMTLEAALSDLLNRYGADTGANTPDWIIAKYLSRQLKVWREALAETMMWHSWPSLGEKLGETTTNDNGSGLAEPTDVQPTPQPESETDNAK